MTYESLIKSARERLDGAGVPDGAVDAFYLLEAATGINGAAFYARLGEEVAAEKQEAFEQLLGRRLNREPLQLITGKAYFFGREFAVDGRELIPRPDTEILVENCLELTKDAGELKVLDLCTGSGCIAIALKSLRPDFMLVATDISKAALDCARGNASRNNAEIDFRCGDLFAAVPGESFDVVISNPPYIRTEEIASLMPEVKNYDPLLALDGGYDGLDIYRRIAAEAPGCLKDKGLLLLEIGEDQAEAVTSLLAAAGFTGIKTCRDYGGHDRAVIGRKG